MSQLKVNSISDSAGANGNAISLASDGTCTAKITNNLSNRNLIINGAMQVAQRGTSSTADSYQTVDRWQSNPGGNNNVNTQAQISLTSSDTGPWEKGFRKAFQLTNGDQTSTDAGDSMEIYHYIEDQNIANSGWNYTSSSSKLTISFWVKSSVAQKFYSLIYSREAWTGNGKAYSYEISNGGSNLSANTWTKITHSIPGDSGLAFDSDNTNGLGIGIFLFEGTNYTTSGHSLNTWAAWNASSKVPDMTATWWETDEATFAITGVQLEVGDVATDFEHRSYGDELLRCQRYFYKVGGTVNRTGFATVVAHNTASLFGIAFHPIQMRTTPAMTKDGANSDYYITGNNGNQTISNLSTEGINRDSVTINPTASVSQGVGYWFNNVTTAGTLSFSAEL